jgi:hypothetical protein
MDPLSALLIAALVVVVLYVASSRNPLTRCGRCSGKGTIRSSVLPWRYRPCPGCGRSGEVHARFGRK